MGGSRKCSRCHQIGHNARTCKAVPAAGAAAPGRAAATTPRTSKFGWSLHKEPEELQLLFEEEAVLKYLDPKYKGQAEHVGAMVAAIRDKDNDDAEDLDGKPELTEFDVFQEVQDGAMTMLFKWMTASYRANPKAPRKDEPEAWEFWAFLAESLLRTFLPTFEAERARRWIMSYTPAKLGASVLLPSDRFNVIQQHVQPFGLELVPAGCSLQGTLDATRWLRRVEAAVFSNSIRIFLCSSTLWSLDDEQHGTQSKDNPNEAVNKDKANSTGQKADAATTAQCRIVFGLRFYQKGQAQAENVEHLLKAVDDAGGGCQNGSVMCCDRGYTKVDLVKKAVGKGIGVIGIVANHLKEHPIVEGDSSTIAPSVGTAAATTTSPATATALAVAPAAATTTATAMTTTTTTAPATASGATEGDALPAPAAAVATPARACDSHDQRATRRRSKRRADNQDSEAGGDGESPRQRRRGAQASEPVTSSSSSSSSSPSPPMHEQGLGTGTSAVGTATASSSSAAVAPSAGLAQSGGAATAPIVDLTSNTRRASSVGGRRLGVDLDRHLGPMIFTATTTVKGDRGHTSSHQKVYALGVRDYTVQDDKATLLKFYCTGSALPLEDLTKTYTMKPHPTCRGMDVKRWLWHPNNMTDTDKVLEEGEDSVVRDTAGVQDRLKEFVVPLTAGQRSADWHILRRFLFTGTTSGVLAQTDPEARKLLLSADASPVERMDKKAAFKELTRGWTYSRSGPAGHGTKDMRTGTANETRVTDQLVRNGPVKQFFDIGLVQSKQHSFMGVSADGIAIIEEPQTKEEIMVAVEIKTKVAPNATYTLEHAVTELRASFLTCTVGDVLWFNPLMSDCRAQLIHQCVVLGLEHVLLVLATVSEIKLRVLVTVPAAVKRTYVAALEGYKSLATWALDVADGTQSRTVAMAALAGVDERDKAIMISHLPMWTALRRRVVRDGPVRPIRLIRSLVQMMYSKGKPGVDGITQDRSVLHRSNQMMFFTFFHDLVINSWTAWRHYKVTSHPNYEWKGIDNFRRQCNKASSLSAFSEVLALALLEKARDLRVSPIRSPGSPTQQPGGLGAAEIARLTAKRPKRGRPAWFDTPDGRTLRSETAARHHVQIQTDKAGRCPVCNDPSAKIMCGMCGVKLHLTKKGAPGCWGVFHGTASICDHSSRASSPKSANGTADSSADVTPASSPSSGC